MADLIFKKRKGRLLKLCLSSLIGVGIYLFCELQTKGFRLQEIFTHFGNNPAWEGYELAESSHLRLHQPFYFLGSGEQCHAFLGADKKTVLKFFRHTSPRFKPIATFFHQTVYDPRSVFESYRVAFESLRDASGLLYIHLNKTSDLCGNVTLFDNIGVAHFVDLDKTEFVLQEYGELAFNLIDKKMQQKDLAGAEASVRALFSAIKEYSRLGVHVHDPSIRRNFGFIGEKVILLDVGSCSKGEQFKTEENLKKEVVSVTHNLGRWIRKHHPALQPCFDKELASL